LASNIGLFDRKTRFASALCDDIDDSHAPLAATQAPHLCQKIGCQVACPGPIDAQLLQRAGMEMAAVPGTRKMARGGSSLI